MMIALLLLSYVVLSTIVFAAAIWWERQRHPLPATPIATDADMTTTLYLSNSGGRRIAEISLHQADIPPAFVHNGITYHRAAKLGPHVWEYSET